MSEQREGESGQKCGRCTDRGQPPPVRTASQWNQACQPRRQNPEPCNQEHRGRPLCILGGIYRQSAEEPGLGAKPIPGFVRDGYDMRETARISLKGAPANEPGA